MNRLRYLAQGFLRLALRHPVVGVCLIATLEDGRIVLVRRRDSDRWGLPGGIVEWGEDIQTTAHRELREETGLSLVQLRRLVGVYSAPDRDPRMHSICVAVEAIVQGNPQVEDQAEIAEVRVFEQDQVPQSQLAHDHRRQLQDYWQGRTTLA